LKTAVGPLLGPVLGPIAGGYLGEAAGWRWVFWVLTIAVSTHTSDYSSTQYRRVSLYLRCANFQQSGLSTLISLLVQRETYEPVLLERRTIRLRKTLNRPELYHRYSQKTIDRTYFLQTMLRPLRMLVFSPIILITSIYVGLVYGYSYLLFTSLTPLYTKLYGFTPSAAGLTYLGFGAGCTVGLVLFGLLSDRTAKARTLASASGEWKPEYRLPPLIPSSLLIPIGLFWYGWSAQARLHWIMPIVGTAWVGLGTVAIFMCVQTYLIDAFEVHAASASAANTVLRSLLGAFLPLAGPGMYAALGQGWGNSVLGLVALGFTPVVWGILRFGERLRVAFPVDS
jgi:MFS family permease